MQLDLPLRDVALFVRHRRARRYILRVLDDGTLRVTLPRWGSKREAQAFVEQSAAWVARQQEARRARGERPAIGDVAALRRRAAEELPAALSALAPVRPRSESISS